MEEKIYCPHCGEIIEGDDYDTIYGEPICEDALTDTQQSATAVRKSSGTMIYTAMKAHASATVALKTTILAARIATV